MFLSISLNNIYFYFSLIFPLLTLSNVRLFMTLQVSVDQSVVDLDIPFRLGGFASTTIQLFGIVGVMTTVTWQILILVVPMAIACLWMQVKFSLFAPIFVISGSFFFLFQMKGKEIAKFLASFSSTFPFSLFPITSVH